MVEHGDASGLPFFNVSEYGPYMNQRQPRQENALAPRGGPKSKLNTAEFEAATVSWRGCKYI